MIEATGEVIHRTTKSRTTKSRTAQLTLVRLCTDDEIRESMRALVTSWCAPEHVDGLVAEQWAWYVALGRPTSDVETVQRALRVALDARGLTGWTVKRFGNEKAAWDAWAAWAALAVYTTASHGWLKGYRADRLTVGIREAYHAGLGIALPAGPKELGFSMDVDG